MQSGRYAKYLGIHTNSLGKKAPDIKNTSFLLLKENTYDWVFSSKLLEV